MDQQRILIAKRPDHLHMGGYWEFPGGKVQPGEKPAAALIRELQEEVGITITQCEPMLEIPYQYPDKAVLLDVWHVQQFSGIAKGLEGQEIRWVHVQDLAEFSFPPANQPIVARLIAELLGK